MNDMPPGLASVMRGLQHNFADGGYVNPFTAYAGPTAYNPFGDLAYLAQYGRPRANIRTPGIRTPVADTSGGYRDIYGNLDAIKAEQAARKAAAAKAPELPAGQESSAGDAAGSPDPSVAGGTATTDSFRDFLGAALTGPTTAFGSLLAQAVMNPNRPITSVSLLGALQAARDAYSTSQRQGIELAEERERVEREQEQAAKETPQDKADRERAIAQERELAAERERVENEQAQAIAESDRFSGPGGRATGAAPTFGGVSDTDIEAAAQVAAVEQAARDFQAGLDAAAQASVPGTTGPAAPSAPSPTDLGLPGFGTPAAPPATTVATLADVITDAEQDIIGTEGEQDTLSEAPPAEQTAAPEIAVGAPAPEVAPAGLAAAVEVAQAAPATEVATEAPATEVATEVAASPESAAESDAGGEGEGGGGEGGGEGGGWAHGGGIFNFLKGGYVPGKSGGMDDDVPAIIDGKGPARLSSGEFVFDAATVAALGDGNNAAGAKKLDGLRKAIRMRAYGHKRQPPKNYSVGDLVRLYDRRR